MATAAAVQRPLLQQNLNAERRRCQFRASASRLGQGPRRADTRKLRSAKLLIPCRDGLSHNEEEWTEPAQMEAGCNVLLRAALKMAQAG